MDKRKMKARRASRDDQNKPSKEEYAVAKCLKFNAPSKEGKFEGNNVRYFMGSKIVDFLLESQWSSKKSKSNPLFSTRPTCVAYCSRLLSKGFFCRVEKQEKKKKELESRMKEDAGSLVKRGKSKRDSGKTRKAEEEGDGLKAGEQSAEEKSQDQTRDDSSNEDGNKKKKKKLPRLNFHGDQKFVDGLDLYVWLYDPVPIKTFIIGLLLVVGAIAVCLFPLWPPEIKLGIYYLSCAAFGFIGVILSLCVVRLIVFVFVWLFSMGEVSLWLLPNLTEDVGFFESFKPLYKINNSSRAKDEKPRVSQEDKESDANHETKEVVKTEDEDDDEEALKTEGVDEGEEEGDLGEATQDHDGGEGGYEDEEDGNESYEVIDAEDDDDDDDGVVDGDDDDDDATTKNAADDDDNEDGCDVAEKKVEADKKND